jgi:hypothetical protein
MKPTLTLVFLSLTAFAQTDPTTTIIERGQDYAVYATIQQFTDASGRTWNRTNEFTLLENALHYLDNGQWQESQDVIEPFPDGAVARYGPHRAIFSADLNAEAVFDIQAADGRRIRGGIRALQLNDLATGKTLTIGTVKASVKGELLPPNQIVYPDAFDGVSADVVLVWKHNLFSHDVILRERPEIPAGWDPTAARLEVLTEFTVDAEPELRTQVVEAEGQPALEDDAVIHFGNLAMVMGKAFTVAGDSAVALGDLSGAEGTVPVLKQWVRTEDGRHYLVESVGWLEVWPMLEDLPVATLADNASAREGALQSQIANPKSQILSPIQLAAADYRPRGCVLDFVIIPDQGTPTTLAAGTTYYIKTSYYSGSSVTFEAGCTLKFKDYAYLLLYGAMSFADTLQTPVFTSRNDDGFGEKIVGVSGETDSYGNPSLHRASQAIWVYYVGSGTTIRNVRIRWARRGVQYDVNPGVSSSHNLQNSLFEQSDTGVYANLNQATLTLSNVKKRAVPTPVALMSGTIYGSMVDAKFYTDKSFEGVTGMFGDNDVQVPDTMGAVGPNHFVEHLNGKIAVFSKSTGQRTSEADPREFFKLTSETREPFDPRAAYDHGSSRWILCAVDKLSHDVVFAVSTNSNPEPLNSSNWRKYELSVARTGSNSDFPTLGLDANGIYLSVFHYHRDAQGNVIKDGNTVVAIRKPAVYQGNLQPVYLFNTISEIDTWAIQPAVNYDTSPLGGYVWFVAKGPAQGTPFPYQAGRLMSRKLAWETSGAEWKSSWTMLSSPASYLTYFDLDRGAVTAPQKGTTHRIDLRRTGSRLMMALIKGGVLWTCQHVGLDGTDGDYDGGDTGASVDRSAVQWMKLQTHTSNPLAYSTHGRIYSAVASDPYWYYMPSLAVNNAGDMVCAFSGSRSSEYIGAFWYGRLANGSVPEPLSIVQSGRKPMAGDLWGDYSHTTLDPSGTTFWTVQEYAGYHQDEWFWSTWISSVVIAP